MTLITPLTSKISILCKKQTNKTNKTPSESSVKNNSSCVFLGNNYSKYSKWLMLNTCKINFKGIDKMDDKYPKHTLDNYAGCVLGGAIGDALGAPVEFMSLDEIKNEYGKNGIQDLELNDFSQAEFTDDTQMTMFTADGLIKDANKNFNPNNIPNIVTIFDSYKLWLLTQYKSAPTPNVNNGWIANLDGLYSRKAPGITCISALQSGKIGTIERPINNSKGCGGVMRVAPVGLLYYQNPKIAFETGARIAAITHGHPDGYLPAGMLSSIIAYVIQGNNINDAISKSKKILANYKNYENTQECVDKAVLLAQTKISPTDAINKIGFGWTGEEALGIALYCVLKAEGNFEETLKIAVNHSGDSDSTGAIAGNIVGAFCGINEIQTNWVSKVEYSSKLKQIAKDLFELNENQDILERYPYKQG